MLGKEGGYSNRASDLGGETYKGISRVHWPNWAGWPVVDQLKEPGDSVADINQTLDDAPELNMLVQKFYFDHFWQAVGCDKLPADIADEVFDTAVNQGTGTSAKYLQEAVNLLNNNGSIVKDLKVDGVVGPVSLAAFDMVRIHYSRRFGAHVFTKTFIKVLDGLQFERYRDICKRMPGQEVNFFGWINQRIGNA